jgi:hypothetical protein
MRSGNDKAQWSDIDGDGRGTECFNEVGGGAARRGWRHAAVVSMREGALGGVAGTGECGVRSVPTAIWGAVVDLTYILTPDEPNSCHGRIDFSARSC